MSSNSYLRKVLTAARDRSTGYVAAEVQAALTELESDTVADMDAVETHLENAAGVARQSGYSESTLALLTAAQRCLDGDEPENISSPHFPAEVRSETYQYR